MKKEIIILIKVLISAILIWFLVHTSKLSFMLLLDLLYSPTLLLFTISIYFVIVVISSWRWYKLNDAQNITLSYSQTILPTYLGIAFNNLLPGGVGGDFFRFYILNKYTNAKKSAVMLSILFDRITGLLGIFITVGIMAIFCLHTYSNQKFTLYFLFICFAICILFLLVYSFSKLLPQTIGFSNWLRKKFDEKRWLNPVLSLLDAIRIYRNSKIIIGECLIASIVIQLLIAATCMLIAKMMHFPPISFTSYIMAIAITQIVNLIPIAPGGFGIGEIAFANVLTLLNPGIGGTYATIFLAYRIIGIVTYLPGLSIFALDHDILKQKSILSDPSAG